MLLRRYHQKAESKRSADVAEEKVKVEKETANSVDFEALTVDELKDLAKEQGIDGYSKMKKAELVKALKG